MQLADLLRGAISELEGAGVPSPQADAETLLAFAAGISRGELQTHIFLRREASKAQVLEYANLVSRRASREPLQHILGETSFFGMDLKVGPGVFVPRPETEYLLDLVRKMHRESGAPDPAEALDIGTGSGAIACGLQRIFPGAHVTAFEVDRSAAAWAARNFRDIAPEVSLELGDFRELLPKHPRQFDLIVSNPPYIPSEAKPIEPEVWKHDPDLALYSGADGLDAIRSIARLAPFAMRDRGVLWLEHADGQSSAIIELLLAEGWSAARAWRDLTGRQRFVSASLG